MENTMPVSFQPVNSQDKFINGWSWGAFFLGFIWALASRLYLYGVLMFVASFIPLVNLVVWIYFAIAGKKLSWEKGHWESFELFEKRQRLLSKIGAIVFVVAVMLAVLLSVYTTMRFTAMQLNSQV